MATGAIAAMTACAAPPPRDPSVLGELASVRSLTFAYELGPRTCSLELTASDSPGGGASWTPFDPNAHVGDTFAVIDATASSDARGLVRAAKLRDTRGTIRWVRNTPASTPEEVERRWSCAADEERLARSIQPLVATRVRMAPSAPTCTKITPLLGDASDVTFEPYDIVGRRLLRSGSVNVPAIVLVSTDRASVLALRKEDLDACFAVTKRAASDVAERERVMSWLSAGPQASPPPTTLATYLRAVGLDERSCLSEGDGPTRHDECRAAAYGATPGQSSEIRLVRERVTDSVHAYGGQLAPAPELAGVNVLVREPTSKDPSFGPAFSTVLTASTTDSSQRSARAARGYRLVRSADVEQGATANAILEIDVAYALPKLETLTQDRRQRQSVGKSAAPNPAHSALVRRRDAARLALASAEREATIHRALFGIPRARCDARSAVTCDLDPPRDLGTVRVDDRRARVAALERTMSSTPATIERDEVTVVDYRAKVHRRQGEAQVTLKLTPTDALPGIPPLRLTRKVPFESAELEVAPDPARGIAGRAGTPPDQRKVAAAVARAVLAYATGVLDTWMQRPTAAAEAAAFETGSRAHLALVARHAASNRRVRLVSDMIEDRPDRLARGALEYPIRITTPAGGCHALVAVPLSGEVDANITLRDGLTRALVARDLRPTPEAALDLCPLAPGEYVLEVSFRDGRAAPTAIGLFESTPGVQPDAEYGSVMPPRTRREIAQTSP